MLGFVCGEVVAIDEAVVLIKNSGIGFELAVSCNTAAALEIGTEVQLFTYLQMREDGLTLFGFGSRQEKAMFLRLISVSGVGPKVALAVLSGLKLNDLAAAIVTGDIVALTSVKGLGKKTAERIVLELKEKLSVERIFLDRQVDAKKDFVSPDSNEAVSVLVSLGLSRADAAARIKNAAEHGAVSTEDLLSYALKNS